MLIAETVTLVKGTAQGQENGTATSTRVVLRPMGIVTVVTRLMIFNTPGSLASSTLLAEASRVLAAYQWNCATPTSGPLSLGTLSYLCFILV